MFGYGPDFSNDGQIDGLVMSDLETFYETTSFARPELLGESDCRKFYSDCACIVCQKRAVAGKGDFKATFDDYNRIVPSEKRELKPNMYLLCPSYLWAYVFKLRTWRRSCCHQS